MTRTFNRIVKQVDDRLAGRRPRGDVHVLLHDIIVYLLELKTFHVKHLDILNYENALSESEKELLAAGEALEARFKAYLENSK